MPIAIWCDAGLEVKSLAGGVEAPGVDGSGVDGGGPTCERWEDGLTFAFVGDTRMDDEEGVRLTLSVDDAACCCC